MAVGQEPQRAAGGGGGNPGGRQGSGVCRPALRSAGVRHPPTAEAEARPRASDRLPRGVRCPSPEVCKGGREAEGRILHQGEAHPEPATGGQWGRLAPACLSVRWADWSDGQAGLSHVFAHGIRSRAGFRGREHSGWGGAGLLLCSRILSTERALCVLHLSSPYAPR